jgi:hypothetical protein
LRNSSVTAVDLPTPVVPTTAKWREIRLSMEISAGISLFWDRQPTGTARASSFS